MALEISSFFEPESCTWSYLLADSESSEAVIIDPVWTYDPVSGRVDLSFVENILKIAERRGLTVTWVLETHAHADHLTGAGEIRRLTGARIACGRGICSVQKTFRDRFNLDDVAIDGQQFDRLLEEGDVLVALNDDLTHAAVLRAVNGDGVVI